MNFFKNMLIVMTLYLTTSINARSIGTASQPIPVRPQPTPISIQQPTPPQRPIATTSTFQNLVAYVKNTPNVWDRNNQKLNTDFVNSMIQKVRIGQLTNNQLEILLRTARDMYGIFSNDTKNDIAILQNVETQIGNALQQR